MSEAREDKFNRCDPATCAPGNHTYGDGCACHAPTSACCDEWPECVQHGTTP